MSAIANLAMFGSFGWQELIVIALVVVFVVHLVGQHRQKTPAATAAVRTGLVLLAILIALSLAALFLTVAWPPTHKVMSISKRSSAVVSTGSPHATRTNGDAGTSHLASNQQASVTQGGSVMIAGSPWSTAVEEHQDFEADIYPSLQDAAKAVGRRLAAQLPGDITVVRFEPIQDNSLIEVGIQAAVAEGLQQKRPELKAVLDPPAPSDKALFDKATLVELTINNLQERSFDWGQDFEQHSGRLTAHIGSTNPAISAMTRFCSEPWVINPNSFHMVFPGHDWLIAFSDDVKTSQNNAHRAAIDAAAKALEPQVRSHFTPPGHVELGSDGLRKLVEAQLTLRQPFTDQFTQRFDRPYGTVWREALLLDAQPTLIDSMAQAISRDLDQKYNRQRTTWFSLIALVGLILATYLFLNAATRGYYAWALRVVFVLGVGVVVYLVMFVR